MDTVFPAAETFGSGRERSGVGEVFVVQWVANQLPGLTSGTDPAF
jgi:hypothetical protein